MRDWREEIRRDIHERMTTSQMYKQDPETSTQEVTLDTIADITKDAQEDGRDTTGIFDEFGNSMFVDPPTMSADQYNSWTASYGGRYFHKVGYTARDVVPTSINSTESDSSKSPGPLSWYYNATEDRTYIGFLRQSDRGFNEIGRFDGDWDDWDESSHSGTNFFGGNNYLVSQLPAEDVSWLKTERAAGRTSDFRAFVDDNDMTDTDSHGRININMINSVKGDYTNYWSVYNANEPVLSDTKITLKFHFRTNSYWRYFGNNAVDSNPSSINTGSTKAQRTKTPPPVPLFYDSDEETPTFYDSFNGRQVAQYGYSGWDFLGDLVDTVEFTVPEGGQFGANGNKIAGKFNINGIGLKWRYITAAENPDQNPAHDEPDNDQNGYNHTRNFPTNDDGDPIPFDDYLIWSISINGQDYELRNGIEGLTCAIGIPGYTKEKWVKGPVNSAKGLPAFTNSYDNKKAIGNVNDMNLEGINQIMNLSKTIQQLKKKKGQQFIQKRSKVQQLRSQEQDIIKQSRLVTPKTINTSTIAVQKELAKTPTFKATSIAANSLIKTASNITKNLPSIPPPPGSPSIKPPSAEPPSVPPGTEPGSKTTIQITPPKSEPVEPPSDVKDPPEPPKPPEPTKPPKFDPKRKPYKDAYAEFARNAKAYHTRWIKRHIENYPKITKENLHKWQTAAANMRVTVKTAYGWAVEQWHLFHNAFLADKPAGLPIVHAHLNQDWYNRTQSRRPGRQDPPKVWHWRIDDLKNGIEKFAAYAAHKIMAAGLRRGRLQDMALTAKRVARAKAAFDKQMKAKEAALQRLLDAYEKKWGKRYGAGSGQGAGGPEGPEGAGPDGAGPEGPEGAGPEGPEGAGPEGAGPDGEPKGNPNAEPLGPDVEKADDALTNDERGIVDKIKDTVLDLAAKAIGAEAAKNTLDSYNNFLKNPKGPGSSPNNPLDITNNFTKNDMNILRDSIKSKNVQDKINNALNSASKGESLKSQNLRWSIAADTVEGALNVASAKSEGLNNTIYGGGTLDRERFRNSNGKDIVFNKAYQFRSGGSVAAVEKSPLGRLASGVGLELDTLGAGSNPAVVIGGVVASQLMVGNSKKYGGLYKSPTAHMQINVTGNTIKESLEKWEKKLIKEDIDLPKKNFFEMDRSDIWRKQDKTKNMIASREKGMRVDQRMAYSKFFTADSQKKADRTLKSVKQEFNYQGKPSPNGFPDQPPKERGKDGFTKDYGQRDAYYNKLDPISANTMQHVGNHDPNMQKKVDSARQDSRLKQRDKILANFKKVVDRG